MNSKAQETIIKKYGSIEAYKQHMRELGAKGGAKTRGYGFAHGKLDPVEIGRLGGKKRRVKQAN